METLNICKANNYMLCVLPSTVPNRYPGGWEGTGACKKLKHLDRFPQNPKITKKVSKP